LIARNPELVSSGFTMSRSSSVPAKPVRDGRGDPPKDVLACPGPLLADDAGDPELSGLDHTLLFKKLPRPARKGGGLFQTTGLLEQELFQLKHCFHRVQLFTAIARARQPKGRRRDPHG